MTYARERGYAVNEYILNTPFTEEAAYLLGFWAGDGWVYKTQMAVALAERDRDHLVKLRSIMGSEHPIKKKVYKGHTCFALSIGSRRLVDRLKELGIHPRKSLTYDPRKTLKHLPTSHHRHFFRGLIDADGYVSERHDRIVLTGTQKACQAFKKFLRTNGVITEAKVSKDKDSNSYRFSIGGVHLTAQGCALLYGDSSVSLSRKQASAKDIIKKSNSILNS